MLFAQLALAEPRVHDADTLYVGQTGYRLAGVDAPEIGDRAECPAEHRAGIAARDRARALVAGARRVEARPAQGNAGERWRDAEDWPRDRFRRRLATISVDGRDLGELLIAEGHAARWRGYKTDWCRV